VAVVQVGQHGLVHGQCLDQKVKDSGLVFEMGHGLVSCFRGLGVSQLALVLELGSVKQNSVLIG
jgi:hypothetical protein